MAQYDGSIRINTQINTKNAQIQLSTLENRISKTADKISSLRSKMDALKDAKIPTAEYQEISTQIQKAELEFNKLLEKQEQMQREGKDNGVAWDRLNTKMDEAGNTIRYAKGELQDLIDTGKAFTLGKDTEEFAKLSQQLQYAEKEISVLNEKHNVLTLKQKSSSNGYRELAKAATSSAKKTGNAIKKFAISSLKNLGKAVSGSFLKITKSANDTSKSASSIGDTFKKMLRYGLGIRSLYALLNKMRVAIVSGFENLAQYSIETNGAISALKSSLTQLKNSFSTAFAPILTTVAPILTTFINMISRVVTYVGMLIAALTGQDTFTKAVAVQEDYAASLKNSADNAKKAEKAQKNYLSGLDEIRRYDSDNNSGNGSNSSPSYTGPLPSEMFEKVPIENSMKDLAESIKEIFSKIFDPFQQSWATKGQQVISSAKNALSALGNLASSVGSSLLQVWTNGTGKTMLETMLQIGSNVLGVIGNIALKLQEAWDKNSVGTGIIQNIANIYQRVLDFVNGIWESTANWAKSLDFYPILESIKNLTEKIEPIVKNIGDLLLWIYKSIILPMAKYLLETAIPFLINKISELFKFISSNQGVIEAIGAGLLAAFAAKKVISGITSIIGAVKNFMSLIKGAGGLLSLLTGTGGIAIAIGAVVAAGVLLYQNWDEICAAGKKIWNDLKDFLSRTWDNIKTNASNMWKGITGFLGKTWEGLKSTASSVFSGIGDVAKGAWDGISKSVSSLCQIIQSNFPKAFNAAVSIIKKPINGIISLINGLINGVVTGINYVLSAFNHLRISVPSWVPGIGGKKLGFNFGMLTAPQIPYLATGAVIPPNAPFMAVLGDQKHGTNIEAPLSVIEDAVERALSKHQNTGGNGNYTFIGQINRRVLFEEVISEAVIQQTVRGKNPFLLGG